MQIVISSGHGKYIRGASGYLDEVDEARLVVEEVARILRTVGVDTKTFHDNTSHDQNTNLNTIVNYHNKQTRDLDISVHFNAYQTTSKPMGVECLYVTQQALANEVSAAIADAGHFLDRGPKKRTDLFFLNNTNEPAILIETCFVDSKADADLYNANFDTICRAIAESVSGETIGETPEPPDPGPGPEPPEPPVIPPADRRRTIGKGDYGNDVEALQRSLDVVVADGDFGSITDVWVRAFQAACSLDVDGIVGPNTWGEVDALNERVANGESGLSPELTDQIVELARRSPLMTYNWPERGQTYPGYLPGMALCFGLATKLHEEGDHEAIKIMAMKDQNDDDTDALSWYSTQFSKLGMKNNKDGLDTLRHLFVLMIGLGPRESSGKYCEGRDLSADNVAADTAEAGLFQTSWNINTADSEIAGLLEDYWQNPVGFVDVFKDGATATKDNLNSYGKGTGARYQWLSRFCPAFHVFVTAVGLRLRRQHWGPINREEVTLKREADDLLQQVQSLVESGGAVA